ncbi:amidohydrolase family protein [Sphingomonas sp. Leaf343]|uniref:amidohydrolase family protein n=1 Tax=Sphingomonas sp. Leaf343 TaxID=1736345 RepID=UPI0006F2236B|nr:amidohydrolase family protein [Sphingomonas sp. Leaf343]KQR80972.1 amidohydrolase [Sphingomonas sp. Leaf343]
MTVIDAHQHFWSLGLPDHHWPGPDLPPIYRDVLPEEFRAIIDPRVAGTVLVQSQANDGDTDWLLSIANAEPMVLGVVGWVDLASASAPDRIAALAGQPRLRGLRAMLECIPEVDWLMEEALTPALQAIVSHDLSLDVLVGPRHLPMLARFVDRWPDLRVVIDHGAKPFTAPERWGAWKADIAVLARQGVHCKLSALRVAGQPDAALRPTVLHLVEQFSDRLMWASDWPVLTLVGEDQGGWLDSAIRMSGLSGAALDQLLAGCARRFYALGG